MKKIIATFCLCISLLNIAQCNEKGDTCTYHMLRSTRKLSFKGVCIPINHVIYSVDNEDINQDGVDELLIFWRRKNRIEGDTTFISFYIQTSDTTVSLLKTFDNFYPIYIDYDKHTHTETINRILECYRGGDPQNFYTINEDKIFLSIRIESGYKIILEYQYDKDENDWYLYKKTEVYATNEGLDEEYKEVELPEAKEWFKDFRYEKILGCDCCD
jgi:hypothetical protein